MKQDMLNQSIELEATKEQVGNLRKELTEEVKEHRGLRAEMDKLEEVIRNESNKQVLHTNNYILT